MFNVYHLLDMLFFMFNFNFPECEGVVYSAYTRPGRRSYIGSFIT